MLRISYTLIAPIYDAVVARATAPARRRSLAALPGVSGQRILIDGVGSGLDLPFLPDGAHYIGLDLTPAMLARARRYRRTDVELTVGDALALPFGEGYFDAVIMHLILAVVPDPVRALAEASRVVKAGGQILVFDKFLKPGQWAPLRRIASPLLRHLATHTDVVFEDVLKQCPALRIERDAPDLARGWFRRIVLRKEGGSSLP